MENTVLTPSDNAIRKCQNNIDDGYKYVVDMDLEKYFDTVNQSKLVEVISRTIKDGRVISLVHKYLRAGVVIRKRFEETEVGVPQGGVISPILANLFMHYAFDLWMSRSHKNNPFERYADDAVVHCRTEQEAKKLLVDIDDRFKGCKLELHPMKTKIVYCQDKDRQKVYSNTEFDFLGYTFRKVLIKDRLGRLQMNFIASVSKKAEQTLKEKVKTLQIHKRTGSKMEMIAEVLNPILRGWMNYFGNFNRSAMKRTLDCVQRRLVKWAMCKYKNFRGHRRRAE